MNAVTTPALANGSVTAVKLAPQAVTSPALAQGAVTSANLAPASVTTPAIANGAITAANLAPNAVTASAIADGTISQSKLNFQLGFINARNPPFGAVGNGTTDDTAAIQSALNNVATNGGGIVFLPQGNYLINSSLVVPAQTSLVGVWRAPTACSQYLGTTLLAVAGAGATNGNPLITLQGNNSTLEGVTIYYPNQVASNPPTPYPWAIQGGGGDNVTIQNVLLVNPYLGIDLATHTSGRHLVRGVYGQPLLVGIAVDQCYDIGRIMEIHFWPFWTQNTNIEAFQSANAVTFDFMRTDWEVVQDVFSWGYCIGARFRASSQRLDERANEQCELRQRGCRPATERHAAVRHPHFQLEYRQRRRRDPAHWHSGFGGQRRPQCQWRHVLGFALPAGFLGQQRLAHPFQRAVPLVEFFLALHPNFQRTRHPAEQLFHRQHRRRH